MSINRVTFLLPSLRGGGAERIVLTIAKDLAEKGYRVDMVLVKAEGAYLNQLPNNIQLFDLQSDRTIFSLLYLVKYLRGRKPSVVFSSLPHVNLLTLVASTLALANSKIFLIEHNTISQSVINSHTLKGKLLPLLMRMFYPFSDGIIAVSNGVASDLILHLKLPQKQVQVIYNPVVTDNIIALSLEDSEHPWLKDGELPFILGVGRLTLAKNFPMLIHAFAKVQETVPSRLIILGDGPDRPTLEELIRNLEIVECVSMPGFVDNPYVFYRKASVFILSSLWEGLPTVLIEALACGTQVISTDCPSGPREILEDGQWGSLISVGDEEDLNRNIKKALSGAVHTISNQPLKRFTVKQSISRYMAIIDSLET